jgi:type II secretory pathway pseudopilin PulG
MVSSLKRDRNAFTLAELLIVIGLVSLIYFVVSGVDFVTQIRKARDLKRKEALSKIQKVLEQFHDDFNRYPTVSEIAYEAMPETTLAGRVCGSEQTDPKLAHYLSELPCEPGSPSTDYVYFVYDNNQKYALFTNLENKSDPKIEELCPYGCSYFTDPNDVSGSISQNYFNYMAASSNYFFTEEPCYGKTNLSYCNPDAPERSRCWAYQRSPAYSQVYCTSIWCSKLCGKN